MHGGLLCGRPDGIPCDPDEDLKVFHNPYTQGEVPFSFVDFMQVTNTQKVGWSPLAPQKRGQPPPLSSSSVEKEEKN